MMRRGIWVFLAALFLPGAADAAAPTIKGYMFGDYYYIASGPDKKENSFQFRRIYLTVDKKWDDVYSGRFRLESNDAGFGAGGKMNPAVKDAWLRYRKNGKTLVIGLSPTPTWSFTEEVWGYRSIEKTLIDRNKVGSSRDHGVSFDTRLDSEGRVSAMVMLGNGNSNKSEIDNDKKAYLRLKFDLSKHFGFTVYGDYETRPGDQDRTTLSGFLYSNIKEKAFGLEAVWQNRKNAAGGADVAVKGASVFARAMTRDDFGFFGRIDYFDPSDQASDDYVIRGYAGVDIVPSKDIHIMPNLIVESFEDSNADAVVIPRVTVYYKF